MGDTPTKVSLRKRKEIYPLAWMFLVMAIVVVLGFLYINRVDHKRAEAEERARAAVVEAEREADRRWCDLMGTLNEGYSAGTPQTEIGRRVAAAVKQIFEGLGC